MSEATPEQTTTAEVTPTPAAPVQQHLPGTEPSRAAVELGKTQAELSAIKAQQAADKAAAQAAKAAAADAKHKADLTAAAKRADEEAAKNVQLRSQLRNQAVLAQLPGLRRPDDAPDQFLGIFTEGVELDDDGRLSEESVKTIRARAEANPFLFESDAVTPGGVPMAGASGRPSGGNWTPKEQRVFNDLGVKPGSYSKHPAYIKMKSTFFKNLGGPIHG
jgi:hypothetical protein|tara:strand:- start:2288 stop:2944 length:657 start_codon:yes stop_codon:yes gene_type:complete